jgi:hypothetical protein
MFVNNNNNNYNNYNLVFQTGRKKKVSIRHRRRRNTNNNTINKNNNHTNSQLLSPSIMDDDIAWLTKAFSKMYISPPSRKREVVVLPQQQHPQVYPTTDKLLIDEPAFKRVKRCSDQEPKKKEDVSVTVQSYNSNNAYTCPPPSPPPPAAVVAAAAPPPPPPTLTKTPSSPTSVIPTPPTASTTPTPGTTTLPPTPPGGIHNIGNTCYIASVVQMMASSDILVHALLDTTPPQPSVLREALLEAIIDVQSGTIIHPNKLKHIIAQRNPQFNNMYQQDAHDLWTSILDMLHEDYLPVNANNVNNNGNNGGTTNQYRTPVSDLLDMDLNVTLTCTCDNCPTRINHTEDASSMHRTTLETLQGLSLPLLNVVGTPPSTHPTDNNQPQKVGIISAMQAFANETLEYTCSACTAQTVFSTRSVAKAP